MLNHRLVEESVSPEDPDEDDMCAALFAQVLDALNIAAAYDYANTWRSSIFDGAIGTKFVDLLKDYNARTAEVRSKMLTAFFKLYDESLKKYLTLKHLDEYISGIRRNCQQIFDLAEQFLVELLPLHTNSHIHLKAYFRPSDS